MVDDLKLLVQETTWQNVQKQVRSVNPIIADLIDKISPDQNLKLLKARYRYGDLILKDGVLQLATTEIDRVVPIDDPRVSRKLQEQLTYSSIPLFLTLHNSNEVFIDTGTRIIPLNLFNPGSFLGLFESTDYVFKRDCKAIWSVSAGARSIFALPKINEIAGLKRLKAHYRLPYNTKLQDHSDHWHIFKSIANNNSEHEWYNEVIFFTKEWLIQRHNDPGWVEFHQYLFNEAWNQAQFAIGKIELSLGWESFVDTISSRRIKPTPYIADQVKHIMLVAAGKWPGFRPASDFQSVAPVLVIQKAIIEVYQLKQYIPTIIHVCSLDPITNPSVYYSLHFPSLFEGSPEKKRSSTIMLDLRDIKMLLAILVDSFVGTSKFSNGSFKNIKFDYFHVEPDKHGEIQLSRDIPKSDISFSQHMKQSNGRVFCPTSPFWRGCIRISQCK